MRPLTNPVSMTAIKSLLIADDDADDKDFFVAAIKDINPAAQVFTVPNGVELMKLLQNFMPDILFLDLEMPFKNGLECLVDIQKKENLHHLPIVVFSSTNRPSNIQTAYDMGAHLFFLKPASYSAHVNSLRAILNLDWSQPNLVKEQYCVNGRYTAFS
jgi:DNA-binding NarL/FixJ family response regulator